MFELRFMDGPAKLRAVHEGDDVVTVSTELESSGTGGAGFRVPLAELTAEIYRAATALVESCEASGLPTDGLDRALDAS